MIRKIKSGERKDIMMIKKGFNILARSGKKIFWVINYFLA